MQAGEVVLRLTLRSLEEIESFSSFLARFLDSACETVDRLVTPAEPPFVMVFSEPADGGDLRTVTFGEQGLAVAFAEGWDRARGEGRALRLV